MLHLEPLVSQAHLPSIVRAGRGKRLPGTKPFREGRAVLVPAILPLLSRCSTPLARRRMEAGRAGRVRAGGHLGGATASLALVALAVGGWR